MQDPPVAVADRDRAVACRVAEQRDEHDLGVGAREHAHALEAKPAVAVDGVLDPARAVADVRGRVAGSVAEVRVHGGGPFRREHVHLGAGEVRQSAGVVDVEMGDRDVADVAGVEAEAADLLQRRLAELALAAGTRP